MTAWRCCLVDRCCLLFAVLVLMSSYAFVADKLKKVNYCCTRLAWHHLVQGSMCIGVACSLIGLAIITNSIEGKILTMTVTVHRTCACVLGIAGELCFHGFRDIGK